MRPPATPAVASRRPPGGPGFTREEVPQMIRSALSYATNGFRVTPVSTGDKAPPLKLGWKHSATLDPVEVAATWELWPEANIGVATGRGLTVVDADSEAAIDTA